MASLESLEKKVFEQGLAICELIELSKERAELLADLTALAKVERENVANLATAVSTLSKAVTALSKGLSAIVPAN